jgi:hypothetical protein
MVPPCSYGLGCKRPMDELFDICGSGCNKSIHKQCAPSRRCPFHVIDLIIALFIVVAKHVID